MKKIIIMSALASAFVFAGSASALTTSLRGSDTMDQLTTDEIIACGAPATNITYNGGGSSVGEQAMLAGTQQTAPMSRTLQASRTCRSATPASANCKTVALDGIAIVMPQANNPAACVPDGANTSCVGTTTCGVTSELDAPNNTFNCTVGGLPGGAACASGATYTLTNQFDALRIIYGGIDHNGGNAIANKSCNSDLRRSLLNQWGKIFTGCTAGACGTVTPTANAHQLVHAFRRGDFSGTTDTFLGLLGMPAMPVIPVFTQTAIVASPVPENPFCNGWEREDGDPVRSTCGANGDTVCNVTAGVVLPVAMPENQTVAVAYPVKACASTSGAQPDKKPARRTLDSLGNTWWECPESYNFKDNSGVITGRKFWNGSTYNFAGLCYVPYAINATTGAHEYDCVNDRTNKTPAGLDGLAENRFLRNTAGALINDVTLTPVGNAFYRLRNATCKQDTSTKEIGCLTNAVACSMGFAGRESTDDLAPSSPAAVHAVLPTVPNIQALVQVPPPVSIYPIARTLNLCSMLGLPHVTDTNESALRDCYVNQTVTNPIAVSDGFVDVPATGNPVVCTDFNETSCNTLSGITCASNTDCGVFPCTAGLCDFSCAAQADPNGYCSAKQPGATCISDHCGFATNSTTTCP